MRIIWTIASKELNYYLNSSLGYLAVIPFIFISYFLYYRSAFVVGLASLRSYFDLLPWFLIILVPALTMQTLSEEKNRKTLELILAHPISESRIVLGKFLGAFIFFLFILLTTATLTLPLFIFAKVDLGIILGQYLGALFIGTAFLSLGIFASSLTANIISSFLLSTSLSFALIIAGLDFVVLSAPPPLNFLLSFLSITKHSQNLSRGLLDSTDLIYFVTLSVLFLIGAIFKISQTKIVEKKTEKSKLVTSFLVTLAVGLLLNIISYGYPMRLDLTVNKIFSLSPATKSSLAKIDDSLSLKIFISPDLPPSMVAVAQEVRDLVADYQRYGKKIQVQNFSPKDGNNDEKEAQNLGITPVQFNTIGANSYQLQKGYLGLALRFGEKTENLPFLQNSQNLEYQLTNRINKLTAKVPSKIDIFSRSTQLQFGHLTQLLSSQYEVQSVKLDKSFPESKPDLLIIAGLNQPLTEDELAIFKNYMKNDGKSLLLLDKVNNDNGGQLATIKTTNLESFLSDYGVTLGRDLVYDLSLAETVQFGQGETTFLSPYPFWFKALPADPKFSATSQIRAVTLLWPASLTVNAKEGYETRLILKSTKNANTKNEASLNVSPAKLNELDLKPGGKELGLAALVSQKNGPPILSVVTDSKFVSDNYYSPQNQNLAFVLGLTDYLVLSGQETVPLRSNVEEFLVFTAPWQPAVVQWGEIVGVPLLIALFAIWHLWRRRQNYNRIYEKLV